MPIPKTTYAVKRTFPADNPSVIVVFKGLLTFCFGGNLNCEVGINNQATPSDTQKHELKINVWKREPTCPVNPLPRPIPLPRFGVEIDVHSPDVLDGVYVYEPDPFTPFNRLTASDERDFRWVLDFEGPDLYNVRLPKLRGNVRPSLAINNGLFYTRQKTKSEFVLFSPAETKPIGVVAKLVAANIYLASGGYVDLKVDGSVIHHLEKITNVTYQIDFMNDCSTDHCLYEPGNPTKETRNDFYLNHRAFGLPVGLEEKQLICTNVLTPVRDPELCGDISGGPQQTTDPAPCMGTGFGQSSSHD